MGLTRCYKTKVFFTFIVISGYTHVREQSLLRFMFRLFEFSDFDPVQFFLYRQSIDPALLFQSAGLGAA